MADYMFSRPIPGQSLTAEPRNAPYERPPEYVDPEEALMMHIDHLNSPDAISAMAQSVDMGLDIRTITEGILRSAVMEGLHTIDVSLLVAPVIHEFIRSNLDVLGYEYDNGFGTKKEKQEAMMRMAEMTEESRLNKLAGEIDPTQAPEAPAQQQQQVPQPVDEQPPMMQDEQAKPMPQSGGGGFMERRPMQ
jgi:hypothetical protein